MQHQLVIFFKRSAAVHAFFRLKQWSPRIPINIQEFTNRSIQILIIIDEIITY